MAKFYRRSFKRYQKRNSERVIRAGSGTVAASSQTVVYTYIAPQAETVKSIKLDVGAGAGMTVMPYALVVVREGYSANLLNYPALTDDLYNPTMDVLISGVVSDTSLEDHKYNSIGRKLKKGDRIALILLNAGTGEGTGVFEISFSVLT